MLGLAWTCDWLGCATRMIQAYSGAWGGLDDGEDGWVHGEWDLSDTGWTVDSENKVWCPVHALVHAAQGAAALELRPDRELPAMTLVEVQRLAERYTGGTLLRIVIDTSAHGRRTVGIGPGISPDPELLAALLEYGPVVVVAHGG